MIAVFISGGGSNLQALIDSPFGEKIAVVVSNKEDAFGIERAKRACKESNYPRLSSSWYSNSSNRRIPYGSWYTFR